MICPVCSLRFVTDTESRLKCVTRHPPNECCHIGSLLVAIDGQRYTPAAWPNCTIVDCASEWRACWHPAERSNEAVGCDCPQDAIASVRIVEQPGLTTTVVQCLTCNDARAIRSTIPR